MTYMKENHLSKRHLQLHLSVVVPALTDPADKVPAKMTSVENEAEPGSDSDDQPTVKMEQMEEIDEDHSDSDDQPIVKMEQMEEIDEDHSNSDDQTTVKMEQMEEIDEDKEGVESLLRTATPSGQMFLRQLERSPEGKTVNLHCVPIGWGSSSANNVEKVQSWLRTNAVTLAYSSPKTFERSPNGSLSEGEIIETVPEVSTERRNEKKVQNWSSTNVTTLTQTQPMTFGRSPSGSLSEGEIIETVSDVSIKRGNESQELEDGRKDCLIIGTDLNPSTKDFVDQIESQLSELGIRAEKLFLNSSAHLTITLENAALQNFRIAVYLGSYHVETRSMNIQILKGDKSALTIQVKHGIQFIANVCRKKDASEGASQAPFHELLQSSNKTTSSRPEESRNGLSTSNENFTENPKAQEKTSNASGVGDSSDMKILLNRFLVKDPLTIADCDKIIMYALRKRESSIKQKYNDNPAKIYELLGLPLPASLIPGGPLTSAVAELQNRILRILEKHVLPKYYTKIQ